MRILYATDGSEGALAGAHLLARWPLEPGDRIDVLSVLSLDKPGGAEAMLAPALEVLCRGKASIGTQVRRGAADEEILRAIEEQPADLVVVGSRGLGGLSRFLLGSVSDRVARHAPCSVLLARPVTHGLRTAVLGVDGSECAAQAAAWLEPLPLPDNCEVHLVTVLPPRYTAVYADHVLWPSLQTEYERRYQQERSAALEWLNALQTAFVCVDKAAVASVETGDPAHLLLGIAEQDKADLIVVGSHGRSAVGRFLLGSVSEKIMRHAHCSVLIVRGGLAQGASERRC
jgi:nucleotide-binding universal stress UspA family protein